MSALRVPEEVMAELRTLGDDPEREALEALLLYLIRGDRISVARAGEILGLDRQEAVRWHDSHGYGLPEGGASEAPRPPAGVTSAREAVALARSGGRPGPLGVPEGRAVRLPPGGGLSDAVLEERAGRDY